MAKHLHVVLYHLSLVLLLTEAQEEIFDETKRDWPRIHCHSKCSTGKFQWQYGVILMLLLHTTVSLVRQNSTSYSPMLLLPSSLDLRICFEWRRQISQIDSSIPLARSWRIFSHLVNIQTIDYVKEREEFQISSWRTWQLSTPAPAPAWLLTHHGCSSSSHQLPHPPGCSQAMFSFHDGVPWAWSWNFYPLPSIPIPLVTT